MPPHLTHTPRKCNGKPREHWQCVIKNLVDLLWTGVPWRTDQVLPFFDKEEMGHLTGSANVSCIAWRWCPPSHFYDGPRGQSCYLACTAICCTLCCQGSVSFLYPGHVGGACRLHQETKTKNKEIIRINLNGMEDFAAAIANGTWRWKAQENRRKNHQIEYHQA